MATPIGNFDQVNPLTGSTGWAIDPDTPSAPVTIHFYANDIAGSSDAVFVGSTIANLPRPDVNAATGYPGNHGFNWIIPREYLTPCPPKIYAYAIDTSGSGTNPKLAGSPKFMPLLVETITNAQPVPITITASSQYGMAISSLHWNGLEFVNASDHGRLLQSAAQFFDYFESWGPECYNPTEGGAKNDGASQCSHTQINSIIASGNLLQTECRMSFWNYPGQTSQGCSTPGGAVNTTVLSNCILEKAVQIGISASVSYPQNIIQYDVTYIVAEDETHLGLAVFEVIAAYINGGNFTTIGLYDESSQTYSVLGSIPDSFTPTNNQVIISTSDSQYAIGIYTPLINLASTDISYDYSGTPGDYLKLGYAINVNNPVAGNQYSYTAYLIIGTLADVITNLQDLLVVFPN